MPITLKELASFCDAQIVGGDIATVIYSAADIQSAKAGQVTQLTSLKYVKHFESSMASACFIADDFKFDNDSGNFVCAAHCPLNRARFYGSS